MDNGTATELIDWARVAELSSEVGAESFALVVEVFLEELDEVAARLARGPASARLAAEMHFLKGCAGNLGLVRLAALCAAAETRAAAGDGAGVDLAGLLACLAASRGRFVEGCARVRAA